MRCRSSARLAVCAMMFCFACGSTEPTHDAGEIDGGRDAGADAPTLDAGPMCEPSCGEREACCGDGLGGASCTQLVSDIRNCGACGVDCVARGRGDACQASQCSCGDFLLGCVGTSESTCCASEGRVPHCANLVRDRLDCGACGNECDVTRANRCDARRCVCGDTRRQCAGTPTDRCCGDRFEVYDCVDTSSDRDHCGDCGNRCTATQRCEAGTCV